MVVLGNAPDDLVVVLVKDSDFFCTLKNQDGDWPATASIELHFGNTDNTKWTATIVDDLASFNASEADVNTLIESYPKWVKLFYFDSADDTDICWAKGIVQSHG